MNVQSIIKKTQGRRAWLAAAGAMILSLAASASSHAAIVVHLNPAGPDYYDWGDEPESPNWTLNITLPAIAQGGFVPGDHPGVFLHTNTGPGSRVAVGAPDDAVHVGGDFDVFVIGFNAGELIPTANLWSTTGFVAFDGFGSALPEGQQVYLGVSFDPGDGDHYGWIGVVREGHDLDAFAWGYETEVGVPIAAGAGIPAPGALSLLALAGAAGRRRRRA